MTKEFKDLSEREVLVRAISLKGAARCLTNKVRL